MEPTLYTVTRLPDAPARRAGQSWEFGEQRATLEPWQAEALRADPGYRIAAVIVPAPPPNPSRPRR